MGTTKLSHDVSYDLGFREDDYPGWKKAFDAETRRQLIEDDLAAGRSVSRVLLGIVVFGLILGVVAVMLSVG